VAKKAVSILGSTGSIGRQTLEVISSFPGKFNVITLAAKGNLKLLEEQIRKFSPQLVSVAREEDAAELVKRMGRTRTTIYFGDEGLRKAASHERGGILVAAIPGSRALLPTLDAISAGKSIALASKEILVSAGSIVMKAAAASNVRILPLDSEHSAIAQCLKGENDKKVKKIILTASGGPFLRKTAKELRDVTPLQALAHPTWQMGKKVTIDSATLMNKGFEVIEAHHLFGIDYSQIDVLIHTQSIVHSMVEFVDGSVIAQLSSPDMKLAIQYALLNYDRAENNWKKLDLAASSPLTFEKVPAEKFPCLELAFEAGRRGGTAPAVLGASDEAAVELFLSGKIGYEDIPKLAGQVLEKHKIIAHPKIEDIIEAEEWAKRSVSPSQ